MTADRKNAVYAIAMSSLISVILTGAAAWFSFGRNAVTKEEMVTYVSTSSPYLRDQGILQMSLNAQKEDIAKLTTQVEGLNALILDQRIILTRLEAYMPSPELYKPSK